MTDGTTRFLAVIDPTRVDQWALQKAASIARDRGDAEIVAYLGVWSDPECMDREELKTAELHRHSLWLDEIIASYEDQGLNIEPRVEWHEDWRKAICDAAREYDADLVIKRASGRPNALASSDRHLIRNVNSALLLVKHDPARDLKKILVAVDFNATDDDHTALNEAVMDLGRRIRGSREDIKLHAVSAFPDSDQFVHPPDVAKALDIARSEAHVRRGAAADVIPGLANEIDTDLVIIGNVGRRGLSGITVGNTAEKILTDIHSDVLVLVREGNEEASATAA